MKNINPYHQSRPDFLCCAATQKAVTSSYVLKDGTGPCGETLATDVATIGSPNASKVVVITSGVHGVELPLGSKLQRIWIRTARECSLKNKDLRFVFVHALNPYGAAYGLRTDQNNVDVNRNFVDFDNLPTTSQNYHDLADAFSPPKLGRFATANAWRKMLSFAFVTHSISAFKQALAGGQYDYPNGLYYGGTEPSWSRKTLENIVQNHIVSPNLKKLWHIDLHTGDGPRGKMQILINAAKDSALAKRVNAFAPPEIICPTAQTLAQLSGDITDFWPKLGLPKGCEVTPMTIEVGTSNAPSVIEGIDVLAAMIKRNTLRVRHKDHHPRARKIIKKMKETFAPMDDNAWLNATSLQGHAFLSRFTKHASLG